MAKNNAVWPTLNSKAWQRYKSSMLYLTEMLKTVQSDNGEAMHVC